MFGRFIRAIGFLLACSTVCGAQQTATPAVPVQPSSAVPKPINSPEMDALAAKLVEKIEAGKITSVVVVGGASPENKVSELGASLRDGLNDALARQAAGIRVPSTEDARDVLTRNRVSAGMIYTTFISEWIAAYAQADAAVVLRVERVESRLAGVSAELYDERQKKVFDKKTKDVVPFAKFESEFTLTEVQAKSFEVEYHAALKTPAVKSGTNGLSMAKCVHCPYTRPYPEEARQFHVQGAVYLSVTVLPDGTVDDVSVDRPVGHGLDAASINTILGWKFAPSLDSQGNPVASRVPIENAFQIQGYPVKGSPPPHAL